MQTKLLHVIRDSLPAHSKFTMGIFPIFVTTSSTHSAAQIIEFSITPRPNNLALAHRHPPSAVAIESRSLIPYTYFNNPTVAIRP